MFNLLIIGFVLYYMLKNDIDLTKITSSFNKNNIDLSSINPLYIICGLVILYFISKISVKKFEDSPKQVNKKKDNN